MRLSAIERPGSVRLWLAYRVSRHLFGKVISPIKVLYARQPALLRLGMLAMRIEQSHLRLPGELVLLVRAYASGLNGCPFCQDLTLARALQQRIGEARFQALADRHDSDVFSDAEHAALDLVEEYHRYRRIGDDTFERLRRHFSEAQVVDLVWVNAMDAYWNALTIPLALPSDGLAAAMRGQDR